MALGVWLYHWVKSLNSLMPYSRNILQEKIFAKLAIFVLQKYFTEFIFLQDDKGRILYVIINNRGKRLQIIVYQ